MELLYQFNPITSSSSVIQFILLIKKITFYQINDHLSEFEQDLRTSQKTVIVMLLFRSLQWITRVLCTWGGVWVRGVSQSCRCETGGVRFDPQVSRGLSVRSSHVLHVPVWVPSGFSGFIPQSDVYVRVCVSLWRLSVCSASWLTAVNCKYIQIEIEI